MIQRIQKWKKQDGFTLVEIIVVLVILAILAAFTIPAMLGFVDDARGKAAIAEGREVYVAAQASTTGVAVDGTNLTATGGLSNNGATKVVTQMGTYLGSDVSATAANTTVEAASTMPTTTTENQTAIKNKVTDAGDIYVVTGNTPATAAKVNQVVYCDQSGKYVCVITPNASGTSAEFFKK